VIVNNFKNINIPNKYTSLQIIERNKDTILPMLFHVLAHKNCLICIIPSCWLGHRW